MTKTRIFCIAVAIFLWPQATLVLAEEAPFPGTEKFATYNPDESLQINHSRLETVMRFVTENTDGGPDYGRFTREAKNQLIIYIGFLKDVPVSRLNKDEQLAFWLNLYNAQMLLATVQAFEKVSRSNKRASANPYAKASLQPKAFMTDKDGALFEKSLTIEGVALSLDDIHNRILFVHWDNPLVMYGLTCPAKSCPQVTEKPFFGSRVWEQLEDSKTRFFESGQIKVKGKTVRVPESLQGHPALADEADLIDHLVQLSSVDLRRDLERATKVEWKTSWRLAGKAPQQGWSPTQGMGMMSRGAGRIVTGGEQ